MILKFFYLALLCTFAAFSLQVDISAEAALLINADTGVVLFEKNSRVPRFPASTTKIATALYLLEEACLPLTKIVTVSADALQRKTTTSTAPHLLASDGCSMGLVRGESLSVEALLHGLLLISGNDAANVLAEVASSSVPHFMHELNAYLERIGCTQTKLQNPHGYHDPQHISTAFDLALIAKRAFRDPTFRSIVAKPMYTIPPSNKRPETVIKQFNSLIRDGKHYYAKAIGGKTGFHNQAGWCLISAAVHEGRTLIGVILGCPQNDNRFSDARTLFETAFAEPLLSRLLVPIHTIHKQIVPGAKNELQAILTKDLTITFYPSEEQPLRAFVHWKVPPLPIAKGQKVGEIRVFDPSGALVKQEDLVAKASLLPSFWFLCKEKLKKWLRL